MDKHNKLLKEVQDYSQDYQNLESDLTELNQKFDELEEQKVQLQANLESTQELYQVHKELKETLSYENSRISKQLEISEKDKQKLEDELKKLTDKQLPKDEIIYLTGMSINKKTFHNVYKFASNDIDFQSYIVNMKSYIINTSIPADFTYDGAIKIDNNQVQNIGANGIGKLINGFFGHISNDSLPLTDFITELSSNVIPCSSFVVKKGIEYYLKDFNNIDNANIFSREVIQDLLNGVKSSEAEEFFNNLSVSDFFAIYQSNQSDSRGLVPLANDSSTDFALNYGYSDLPFYENLFINDVSIEICSERLFKYEKNISSAIGVSFLSHGLDIFLSRLMAFYIENDISFKNKSLEKNISDSKGSFTKFIDLVPKSHSKQLSNAFKERNLFGIDLLSRVLSCFSSALNPNYIEAPEHILKEKYVEAIKLKVYIDSHSAYSEHLIELFECASTKSLFDIIDRPESADITIRMSYLQGHNIKYEYERNEGVTLQQKRLLDRFVNSNKLGRIKKIRIPVKLFMSIPQIMKIENNYKDEKFEICDKDFAKYYNGYKSSDEIKKPLYSITKSNFNYIKKNKVLIPHRLIHNSKDQGDLNILTVGGVEHNRPLMRLINAHRMQKAELRTLGFFDNMFDFIHREHNEKHNKHYFLAGVNQPVSGFNALLSQREDDLDGKSVGTSAKLIYFKVDGLNKEGEVKPFNVLSIYGFSALASAFATLFIIYQIKQNINKKYSLVASAIANSEFNDSDVFTRRIIFKPNNYMESRFHEICDGLEYLSFVRVDNDNKLGEFITTAQNGTDSSISKETPIIDDSKAGVWSFDTGKSNYY